MANRYFVEAPITSDRATLVEAEAHHLRHVMRARPGDEVVLFDGSGWEVTARVEVLARSTVELAVLDKRHVDRELPRALTLGVALPKGERQRWLIEKAVELGVGRLVPLETERSVAKVVEAAVGRLRRAVIEASKQCGRNRLMEIATPQGWSQYVAAAPTTACRLVAHPNAALSLATPTDCAEIHLAVGPEGGFSDDEISAAQSAGWQLVGLGPRVLRVETAAILLVARVTRGVEG